jgi:hypothetical protein
VSPWYNVKSSNITFYLNTSVVNQSVAESNCKRYGGHLAAYTSIEEQAVRPLLLTAAKLLLAVAASQQRRAFQAPCVQQPFTEPGRLCRRPGVLPADAPCASRVTPPSLQEVESFFIDGGWLFPKKHIQYWTGLRWGARATAAASEASGAGSPAFDAAPAASADPWALSRKARLSRAHKAQSAAGPCPPAHLPTAPSHA